MNISDLFKVDEYKEECSRLKKKNAELQDKLNRMVYTEEDCINLKKQIEKYKAENTELNSKLNNLGYNEYNEVKQVIEKIKVDITKKNTELVTLNEHLEEINLQIIANDKKLKTAVKKIDKSKELYNSIVHCLDRFKNLTPQNNFYKLPELDEKAIEELSPSVMLKLHYMDMKDLRKVYRENDKLINTLLEQYEKRYLTKANKAIFKLIIFALRSELQNILYNLKYDKLENAELQVKEITAKYLQIGCDGNLGIASTLTKFIGEIEYLFLNSVKIEYNYYVKKEQAKQEQLAIREQMRQEAEERKALELEKKRIEAEEQKYKNEIAKLTEQIANSSSEDSVKINSRILELQSQLSDVIVQKDKISELANGKAGNIYVISNLGSFGDNVFKIGMTRRMNPQDRVDELGDASVPFKFDVHSFIFSDDAVALETKLHQILDDKRVNKVNRRKEFFNTTVDELEKLIQEIQPTAEFNKTMIAEEFRQSLSSTETYSDNFVIR